MCKDIQLLFECNLHVSLVKSFHRESQNWKSFKSKQCETTYFVCMRLDLTWLDPDFVLHLLQFVPVAGVGSRWLILLIPDLQAVLFFGSMPPRLQAYMSAFTQSDHVFLRLPRAFEHGTSILVTDLIQGEDRTTYPYHLRRLERTAAVTSTIPSLAHNKSMEISLCGLTP